MGRKVDIVRWLRIGYGAPAGSEHADDGELDGEAEQGVLEDEAAAERERGDCVAERDRDECVC